MAHGSHCGPSPSIRAPIPGRAAPPRRPSPQIKVPFMNEIRIAPSAADRIDHTVRQAREALKARQEPDGHWLFELEADVTIPAEYILLRHFLGEIDAEEERAVAAYIRATQGEHGGWPLFAAGDPDLSATVKAYYTLKLAGDDVQAEHMRRARGLVLAKGGAARSNVFTLCTLAMFGQVPWRAVPVMPLQIMLLPRWFPFHLAKVSYWSRTVIVPLLILMALRARARNPTGLGIPELFVAPPEAERNYIRNPTGAPLGRAFVQLDRLVRAAEPYFPKNSRERAFKAAVDFILERLNGEDG